MTTVVDGISIRHAEGLDELRRCVELQTAVWGYDEADVVPRKLFLLAQRIGGQVIGAFSRAEMVGFAMALPGYRDGRSYLHSHMLAVLPQHRSRGIGRALKLAQRDDALARGIRLMEWTFDPLEIPNGYLNITRLGAISRRYEVDFYGPSSSPLQGGLPTDRLYAEWWLDSERVRSVLSGSPIPVVASERIAVPGQIRSWKADEKTRNLAAQVQTTNRNLLKDAFRRGLAVVGYERNQAGDGCFLLAEPGDH